MIEDDTGEYDTGEYGYKYHYKCYTDINGYIPWADAGTIAPTSSVTENERDQKDHSSKKSFLKLFYRKF